MKIDEIKDVLESTIARRPNLETEVAAMKGHRPTEIKENTDENRIKRRTEMIMRTEGGSMLALERILGTNDLVDVVYLKRALNAAAGICRLIIRDDWGREIGYGTGFKVSSRLILTNQHVLTDIERAANALAEFDYELDLLGNPKSVTRFRLSPQKYFLSSPYQELDFALVAIEEEPVFGLKRLSDYPVLPLIGQLGKINPGEFVTVVQHPGGQPKQIALRENELLKIEHQFLLYQSDTAQGSSGSPLFNDSWQVVGLHHSGKPRMDDEGNWLRKDGEKVKEGDDDSVIDWVANEGIRASFIVNYIKENGDDSPFEEELFGAAIADLNAEISNTEVPRKGVSYQAKPFHGGARVTVPVSFDIKLSDLKEVPVQGLAGSAIAFEAMKVPYIQPDYSNRKGYDKDFLGIEVALPTMKSMKSVSVMDDGNHIIPYHHFSVVMNKHRRLAYFCASNLDLSPEKQRPEPNRTYNRRTLSGLRENDREKWLTDPRIPENHQLPDKFYNYDRQSFDKGHLVRRIDVAWGGDFEEVRSANGDTYHNTNCSPQVGGFNRSDGGGIWGLLENDIERQAKKERLCVFSGTVFRKNDRWFTGKDDRGDIKVKIPRSYWKVVVSRNGDKLETFAFVLTQSLANVSFEFSAERWKKSIWPVEKLEEKLKVIRFPDSWKTFDQYEKVKNENRFESIQSDEFNEFDFDSFDEIGEVEE